MTGPHGTEPCVPKTPELIYRGDHFRFPGAEDGVGRETTAYSRRFAKLSPASGAASSGRLSITTTSRSSRRSIIASDDPLRPIMTAAFALTRGASGRPSNWFFRKNRPTSVAGYHEM